MYSFWQDLSLDTMTLTLWSLTLEFETFGGALSDLTSLLVIIMTE
jgi:hypothetical protein